jgi:hypothetical protein
MPIIFVCYFENIFTPSVSDICILYSKISTRLRTNKKIENTNCNAQHVSSPLLLHQFNESIFSQTFHPTVLIDFTFIIKVLICLSFLPIKDSLTANIGGQ